MADDSDPFAKYLPGAAPTTAATPPAAPPTAPADADPYSKFLPGPASTQPAITAPTPPVVPPGESNYDPSWKPSGNAFVDFMTRPRAKTEDPFSAARDYALSGADAATFGHLPDALTSSVNQAHANLGMMDPVATTLGYALGPGKILGPAARMATGLLPEALSAGRVGSAIAAGTEGAVAGGAGAQGHGGSVGDIIKSAIMGAGTGAIAGGVAGGSGPIPKAPDVGEAGSGTQVPTGMYAAKNEAYAPLDSIYFKGDHQPALQSTWDNLIAQRDPLRQGVDLGVPQEAQDIVSKIGSQSTVTGRNLQKASADLRSIGGPEANRFADALDGTLNNATPMPGSTFNGAPAQVGQAGQAQSAGNAIWGRIQDLNRLGDDPANIPPGAVKQTMAFPQNAPGTPSGDALAALSKAQQPGFNFWTARHVAAPLLGAAGLGLEGYVNPAEKQNPWISGAREALEGALLFKGGKALAAPRPATALNAARYAIGTGNPITTPTGRVGDALMNLMYGRAASGQPPY